MKNKLAILLAALMALPMFGAQIIKTPTEFTTPATLTIDLGVLLYGTWDFTNATVLGITTLPTQSGNNGKYLTTNGTTASWASIAEGDVTNLVTDLSLKVPTSRTISTTAPISGGGALSGNLTLSMHVADATHDGYLSQADWNSFNGAVTSSGVSSFNSRTGAVLPATNDYSESQLSFTDILTNDVSSTKHGFQPKLPNDDTLFMNGVGSYVALPTSGVAGTQLISGGGVAWTGNLNFTISAATYAINGTQYSSPQTNVTLGAADAIFDRIDIFAVDTSGAAVVIAGTPGSPPAAPNVDPSSQLELTFAYVAANATTPSNATNENIYLENTEYTSSTNSAGTISLASTNNPFAGTKDIEGTNTANGNFFTLVKPSGNLNLSQYTSITFQLRSKASWPNQKAISVSWLSGATNVGTAVAVKNGVLGFNSATTGSYQQIVMPASSFGTGSTTVDRVRFSVAGGGGNIGWYVDNIILQAINNGGGGGGGTGTGDVSSNTTTSVDGEVALFSGTTGKLIKRATGSGLATVASGVLGTTTNNTTNWDTAYTDRLKWDGGSTGLTAATGRTSLGATTVGSSIFSLTNPSAITWIRINADNTVTARSAANTLTDLGATTVGGNIFTVPNPSAIRYLKVNADNTVTLEDASTFLSDIGGAGTASISDTAFASSWDGVTTVAPSKNAVFDSTYRTVTFVVDGSGSVLTTGTKNPVKVVVGGTLAGWTMMCSPSGSVTADVYRAANGAGLPVTSIVGGSGTKPAVSSGVENSSTSFTSWTSTAITASDNLAINLSGITAATYMELTLYYR